MILLIDHNITFRNQILETKLSVIHFFFTLFNHCTNFVSFLFFDILEIYSPSLFTSLLSYYISFFEFLHLYAH